MVTVMRVKGVTVRVVQDTESLLWLMLVHDLNSRRNSPVLKLLLVPDILVTVADRLLVPMMTSG